MIRSAASMMDETLTRRFLICRRHGLFSMEKPSPMIIVPRGHGVPTVRFGQHVVRFIDRFVFSRRKKTAMLTSRFFII